MHDVKRYDRIRMEYPELGWDQIQALREKLGQKDRQIVEGLLEKIETLYWELERARLSSRHVVVTEITKIPVKCEVPKSRVDEVMHVIEMCACHSCQTLRYST